MDFSIRVAVETILKEVSGGGGVAENVIVSPASLDIVLRSLACGAKGRTLDQMLDFLGGQGIDDLNSKAAATMEVLRLAAPENNPPVVSCGNGIWVDRRFTVKASFGKLLADIYRAESNTVDFQSQPGEAVKEINAWAEKSTNGRINNVLSPQDIESTTALVLTNALYFKAMWDDRFFPRCTSNNDFYLLDGTTTVTVPFMRTWESMFYYASLDEFKVLELSYQSGESKGSPRFSMYFFLPHKAEGLPEMLNQPLFRSSEALSQTLGGLEVVRLKKVRIPKWKFARRFEPTETMEKLGLTLPFKMTGDLAEMLEEGGELLYVSKVIQSACIAVDEDGTEAAAVSAVLPGIGAARYSPPQEKFIADHPFVFMIVESKSQAVLFAGAVFNPQDQQ
ncbi:unnamed protein product [Linum tenue]|uniref:Serpin domain-containing protein n=1 Tax=Linum tenue TaxID=586396 RepID=A0AAV0KJ29_9ROSI|nr:unnamed protein product [Linum tenue]